jgi:hypothetical protein
MTTGSGKSLGFGGPRGLLMIYDWARYIQARRMAAVLAASSRRISGSGVYNDDGAPRVDDDEGINKHSNIDQ